MSPNQQHGTPSTLLSAAFCLVLAATVGGCSDSGPVKEMGTVTGTLTLDGTPVTKGEVRLSNSTLGAGATAPLGEGGAFTMTTPIPVGEYVVTVGVTEDLGPQAAKEANVDTAAALKDIPVKYQTPATSDLKATVAVGENKVELDMKK